MYQYLDFEFAFNHSKFSDKILRLVISPGDHHHNPTSGSAGSVSKPYTHVISDDHRRKRHRADDEVLQNSQELPSQSKNQICDSNKIGLEDSTLIREENQDQETVAEMHDISLREDIAPNDQSGDEASKKNETSCEMPHLESQDRFVHVSSVLLAAHSPFFNKLFMMVDSIRPLLDRAMKFLAEQFKYMDRAELQEDLLKLPLVGVEAVLSSDYLVIDSEDDIYDFMLEWVQTHYSDRLEEGRKILNMLVGRFLRFPFLTTEKLECVLTCRDIDPAIASKLAIGTLRYFKAQTPHNQAPDKFRTKRVYKSLHLKAAASDDSPSCPQCIVYFDLKRDACEAIFPSGEIYSETFYVGEHGFILEASCSVPEDSSSPCFGLYVRAETQVPETGLTVSLEVAFGVEEYEDFTVHCKDDLTLRFLGDGEGWSDLFDVPWTTFISEASPYFINDSLRLRCHLIISL